MSALDEVQEFHPGFKSEPGHLLYARSQEELGRIDDALTTYESLVSYAGDVEPAVRYGLLLQKLRRADEARVAF
ncbi:MAG: hypothetical protein HOI34_02115 [Rhodospirillaceae bacterium]|nr:hypothetical protein [Rhodospirillaceae bacterium]MBT6202479.1 hypothetical protein [Rhodospirillaceae bacterium]MBT6511340.1 hypothetical protein [Rhodospirillaceae bacterium]MBT7646453.1 hypothetical protein [Rhodospirillaceae bacterium]